MRCGLVAGRIDSLLDDLGILLVVRNRRRAVYGVTVDTNFVLVDRELGRRVDGGAGYVDLFPVVGLDARAIFTLDKVKSTVVGTVSGIELDTRFSVRVTGPDDEKNIVLADRYLINIFFSFHVLSFLGQRVSRPG